MKNRFFKKLISIFVCATVVLSSSMLFACGSSSDKLMFWVYGGNEETALYRAMTDKFNATYGAEHDISVDISIKPPASYGTAIEVGVTSSSSCPDVFLVVDDSFRTWIGKHVITDMDEYLNAVTDIDISDIYETSVSRLRYTEGTKKITATGHQYGLPISSRPLALYYNETIFKNAGVIIISVDEEDMAAFNGGNFADKTGKTLNDYKTEYPKLAANLEGDIPAKGFFRSINPYVQGGISWVKPDKDNEVLIFNNRIPMNWDEVEDLAMLFTPTSVKNNKPCGYNNEAKTYHQDLDKGFYTQWWFSYGWSVGGDCLQDLTGNGDWDFALLDDTPNYMVQKDGFVGNYTGKTYSKGETLEFLDRFNIPQGATIVADNKGGYKYNGNPVATLDFTARIADGTLYPLPSIRDAFTRYLRLGTDQDVQIEGLGGLDVAMKPLEIASKTMENFFFSCNLAMLVDYSSYLSVMSEQAAHMNFEYDVAPIPIYKEYTNPEDPYDDSTNVVGKPAGQSSTFSMVSCPKSQKHEKAAIFMKWMASKEGQSVCAERGFFTNQASLVDQIQFAGRAPKNVKIFAEGLQYQRPGDWMYMPDYAWIDIWAVPLNSYVRNGKNHNTNNVDPRAYDVWKDEIVAKANNYLKVNY